MTKQEALETAHESSRQGGIWKTMTKKEALKKARESSRQGGIWVAWKRFAVNQYLVTHYAIFVEFATMGDRQIAGFENGKRTF